ncbi:MAG: TIGR02206 family membrane protein [Candidatus Pristimantibacillus sp.]
MAFEIGSQAHIAALVATGVVCSAIILFRERLRRPRIHVLFRYVMAGLLVCCELSLQIWYVVSDNWGLHSFPFQLCSLMVLLSAALLLTRNRKLNDIVFFLGILGALQALLTPNLDVSFPHFRYFNFFIAHLGIIAACVYTAAVESYRPNIRSLLRAFLWLHVLAVPAAITNYWADTNFMFLARKPSTASLLDMLAPWPWYLLQLELVVLLLCLLLLGLMQWFRKLELSQGN